MSALGLLSSAPSALTQQMSHPAGSMSMSAPMGPPAAAAGAKPRVALLHCLELTPFVDPLPIPAAARPNASGKLRIGMREVHAKIHRDVAPTRMWCYSDLSGRHPAGIIPAGVAPVLEARSGQPLEVEWVNQLPAKHFLPVDFSLHGCGHDIPEVRACVHLHGGRTPSSDDGFPEDWFVPGKSRTCRYPLQQDAATLWYHDHAMGLNRLNMYAGLFGMAVVRDREEEGLQLPSGKYDVPLMI